MKDSEDEKREGIVNFLTADSNQDTLINKVGAVAIIEYGLSGAEALACARNACASVTADPSLMDIGFVSSATGKNPRDWRKVAIPLEAERSAVLLVSLGEVPMVHLAGSTTQKQRTLAEALLSKEIGLEIVRARKRKVL